MDDLRRMLRDKADEIHLDPELPRGLRARARRRRIGTGVLTGVVVVGLGFAAFAGARQLVDGPSARPRPAQQPPATGGSTAVWPSFGGDEDVAGIDAIQEQVDLGHQPGYLSPEIVAQMFAMEALQWKRGDIEASVLGDNPVQVAISNPNLERPMGDARTILTMERWRGRPDGVYVITQADVEVLDLRSPSPWEDVSGAEELTFSGALEGISQRLLALRLRMNIEGTQGTLQPGAADIVPGPDGEFETSVPVPDEAPAAPGVSVFVQTEEGTNIAVEVFRLGPPVPLPPAPVNWVVLPLAVSETRDAIMLAANQRDWQGLEALIDPSRFEFSFGGETDPIAFWKRLEREGEPVRQILATLLSFEGDRSQGLYIWPAAATKEPKDWTDEDLEQLARIYSEKELEQIRAGDSYYGWRVGIEQDGTWIFFIAGD